MKVQGTIPLHAVNTKDASSLLVVVHRPSSIVVLKVLISPLIVRLTLSIPINPNELEEKAQLEMMGTRKERRR